MEYGAMRNIILKLLPSLVHQWMESTVRISTGSIFLLILYEYVIIFILSVIMEAFRSVIMTPFRDQFIATELLSYKELLYDGATEEWYAQRYERVQRTNFHPCTLPITNRKCSSTSQELSPTRVLYIRVSSIHIHARDLVHH